jgi:DNA-binding protein YbaB
MIDVTIDGADEVASIAISQSSVEGFHLTTLFLATIGR